MAAHVGPINRCRRRWSLAGASAALLSGRPHDRGTHNDRGLLLDLGRGHSSGRHTVLVRTGGLCRASAVICADWRDRTALRELARHGRCAHFDQFIELPMQGLPTSKRRLHRATLPWRTAVKIEGLQARDGWAPEQRPEPSSHTACKQPPSLAPWASTPSQIQSAPDPRCSGLRARRSPPQVPLLGPRAACNASSDMGGVPTSFRGALPADHLPRTSAAAAAAACSAAAWH